MLQSEHINAIRSDLRNIVAEAVAEVNREAVTDNKGAARRINMSESWLNHARSTDDGPPYLKIGNRIRYKVADLDAWLEAQKSAA